MASVVIVTKRAILSRLWGLPTEFLKHLLMGGAKLRQSRTGTFVAIRFWDVLYCLEITAIFEFGVVAISFFFA
jgi:hypothetical protein